MVPTVTVTRNQMLATLNAEGSSWALVFVCSESTRRVVRLENLARVFGSAPHFLEASRRIKISVIEAAAPPKPG